MKKIRSILLIALLLLPPLFPASAEVFDGTVVCEDTVPLVAESGGVLESLSVRAGDAVTAGQVLGQTAVSKVFASCDGVAAPKALRPGDDISGTVVEITPERKYTVMATSDGAYNKAENQLIHMGEKLYIRCTEDGSHHAVGLVTAMSGSSFDVEIIGGELFVGETVFLYRTADYDLYQRVGKGTAVATLPLPFSAAGTLQSMDVGAGEKVQRGQLLFTWTDKAGRFLTAPADGIISALSVIQGDQIQAGQIVGQVSPYDRLRIRIFVPDEDLRSLLDASSVSLIYAGSLDADIHSGRVCDVARAADKTGYRVLIESDAIPRCLGLSVEVQTE